MVISRCRIRSTSVILISCKVDDEVTESTISGYHRGKVGIKLLEPVALSPFPAREVGRLTSGNIRFVSIRVDGNRVLTSMRCTTLEERKACLMGEVNKGLVRLGRVLTGICRVTNFRSPSLSLSGEASRGSDPGVVSWEV